MTFSVTVAWKRYTAGVKQGFKEDKALDGPGFVYYSHVVKLYTIRISLFRPNRGSRRIAIQDVKTAFLQSDKFPPETIKYMKIFNPVQFAYQHMFQQRRTLLTFSLKFYQSIHLSTSEVNSCLILRRDHFHICQDQEGDVECVIFTCLYSYLFITTPYVRYLFMSSDELVLVQFSM